MQQRAEVKLSKSASELHWTYGPWKVNANQCEKSQKDVWINRSLSIALSMLNFTGWIYALNKLCAHITILKYFLFASLETISALSCIVSQHSLIVTAISYTLCMHHTNFNWLQPPRWFNEKKPVIYSSDYIYRQHLFSSGDIGVLHLFLLQLLLNIRYG